MRPRRLSTFFLRSVARAVRWDLAQAVPPLLRDWVVLGFVIPLELDGFLVVLGTLAAGMPFSVGWSGD